MGYRRYISDALIFFLYEFTLKSKMTGKQVNISKQYTEKNLGGLLFCIINIVFVAAFYGRSACETKYSLPNILILPAFLK